MAIKSSEGKEGKVMGHFDCLELDSGDERVMCSWVRMRGTANKVDIMVEVC